MITFFLNQETATQTWLSTFLFTGFHVFKMILSPFIMLLIRIVVMAP